MWENTRLVNVNGQQRVQVEYLYRNNPHETFKPENSNLQEAKARTDSLIKKLKRNGSTPLLSLSLFLLKNSVCILLKLTFLRCIFLLSLSSFLISFCPTSLAFFFHHFLWRLALVKGILENKDKIKYWIQYENGEESSGPQAINGTSFTVLDNIAIC